MNPTRPAPMIRCWAFCLALPALLALAGLRAQAQTAPASTAAPANPAAPPAKATPIMTLEQVRVGMKGYGLTVFHGATVEPFAVEVVSVMHNFNPGKGAIWIRCPDERMQISGPVHGMSGSPIYLWADDEPHLPGKGGRLIGAFAFGFGFSKDCFVGVQPIENMLAAGNRADDGVAKHADAHAGASTLGAAAMQALLNSAAARGLPATATWKAAVFHKLLAAAGAGRPGVKQDVGDDRSIPAPASFAGRGKAMSLPMTLTAPGLAPLLAPLLEPAGITPLEAPIGAVAGMPPPGVDAKAIPLAPGSVLAIPLAWGDMDLSAQGTVTDVLPDGKVLAFGHAMFGQGATAVPMASGFVHMVMPSVESSFKLGGSAVVRGAIRRDENTAVVGVPGGQFEASPVRILIKMPDQKPIEYNYQVVQHQMMTPILTSILVAESLVSSQNPPLESTAHVTGSITFTGGRSLDLDDLTLNPAPPTLVMQFVSLLTTLARNPHESMMVQSADVTVDVTPTLRVGSLASARLDRTEVAPGQRLGVTFRVQPYGHDSFEKRTQLAIPAGLADGEYQLHVCDAQTYTQLLLSTHPHLMTTTNADELFAIVKRITEIRSDAAFVVLQLQEQGVAVGLQEMPHLPSSRKAIIATPTSTLATTFTESMESVVPLDVVSQGDLTFTVTVRKNRKPE